MQEERIDELKDLLQNVQNRYDTITLNVGIHGLYTTGENTIRRLVEIAKAYDLPIHMHFCENAKEVDDIRINYSVGSTVDVLEKYFSGTKMILAHAVKLTDEEIERLIHLNISIAHCPISNLRLGCGVAKAQKMIDTRNKCSTWNRWAGKWIKFRYV